MNQDLAPPLRGIRRKSLRKTEITLSEQRNEGECKLGTKGARMAGTHKGKGNRGRVGERGRKIKRKEREWGGRGEGNEVGGGKKTSGLRRRASTRIRVKAKRGLVS